MDLKESAHQLVSEALCEVLARYTETEIDELISNIKIVLEMSAGFDSSVTYTLEQMLENLEFTKSDLEQQS